MLSKRSGRTPIADKQPQAPRGFCGTILRACPTRRKRMRTATVLIVDDDRVVRRTLEKFLVDAGYVVETATDGVGALERLMAGGVDVCLLDLGLPGMTGMDVLRKLRDDENRMETLPAVIVISARDDMRTTVQAVQLGAYDYLVKPPDANRIRLTVQRALEQRQTSLALAHIVAEEREDHGVGNIVGKSESIRDVYKKIGAVSTSRATVLITGESGTGKELVARAIHFSSETAQYPFVAVNCTAFPHHLLESELFGHVRGAFTGAVADKIGRFQLSGQGSLFLDEIGELPIDLQAKLLRVLQERVFERVGDTRPVKLTARVIAATHRDLQQMVREGTFREDLYYRLRIVEVHLPPLRERREDIPLSRRPPLSADHARNAPPGAVRVPGGDGRAHAVRLAGECSGAGKRADSRRGSVSGGGSHDRHAADYAGGHGAGAAGAGAGGRVCGRIGGERGGNADPSGGGAAAHRADSSAHGVEQAAHVRHSADHAAHAGPKDPRVRSRTTQQSGAEERHEAADVGWLRGCGASPSSTLPSTIMGEHLRMSRPFRA